MLTLEFCAFAELLRKSSEHTLVDMVQLLFSRLPQFKEDPKWATNIRKVRCLPPLLCCQNMLHICSSEYCPWYLFFSDLRLWPICISAENANGNRGDSCWENTQESHQNSKFKVRQEVGDATSKLRCSASCDCESVSVVTGCCGRFASCWFRCDRLLQCFQPLYRWWSCSVGRTSVFGWRTFPDIWMTCIYFVGKVLQWVSQPSRLSLPSLQGQLMSSNPCNYMDYGRWALGQLKASVHRDRWRTSRCTCVRGRGRHRRRSCSASLLGRSSFHASRPNAKDRWGSLGVDGNHARHSGHSTRTSVFSTFISEWNPLQRLDSSQNLTQGFVLLQMDTYLRETLFDTGVFVCNTVIVAYIKNKLMLPLDRTADITSNRYSNFIVAC